jgi:hypothetical protein
MSYREMHKDLRFHSPYPSPPFIDAVKHPVIATVNIIAAELFGILGPVLWAALVVLFLVAEFSSN